VVIFSVLYALSLHTVTHDWQVISLQIEVTDLTYSQSDWIK